MKLLNIILAAFGAILIALGMTFLVIPALAAVIPLAELLWPLIAVIIVIGIALAIRKWFAEQAKALWEIVLFKKIFQTILLAGLVYLPLFYLSYGWLTSKLIESTGFSYHHTLIIVTILQLPMVGVLYYLFSLIWPERGRTMKGFLIISLIGPLVITYVMYQNPYRFFDHRTGENKIWVSDTEERIYYSPGYGMEDGKALRPGTARDAEKFKEKKEGFRDFIEEKFKKWSKKEVQAEQVRRLSGVFKLPADGRMVSRDIKGQELWYRKGEYVRFEQLGSPGKLTIINQKSSHPTWSTGRKTVTSSRTKYSDKIRLMAAGEKEIIVQVRIIPPRS